MEKTLKKAIEESGNRLHLRVADLLTKGGWTVQLSPYYVDELTTAPREIDIIASRRIPHTIATASEKTNVLFFFEHLQLDKWFDVEKVVYDDGTLPGKPAPDIYLRVAQKLGLNPNDCIVVEDAQSGIKSAESAGIGKIVALGPQERHTQLLQLKGVDEVISNLSELSRDNFEL